MLFLIKKRFFQQGSFFSLCLPLLLLLGLFMSGCEGGLCAATVSALSDADGDCTLDEGDNCPTLYNPDQYDADSDGLGWECDTDDTDGTVGMSLIKDPLDILPSIGAVLDPSETKGLSYAFPGGGSEKDFEDIVNTAEGFYYLISCDDNFLGVLSTETGDDQSLSYKEGVFGSAGMNAGYSVLNRYGFYGRPNTSCSAFSETADYPPAVFFHSYAEDQVFFVGYLSLNTQIPAAWDSCGVLEGLGLSPTACSL